MDGLFLGRLLCAEFRQVACLSSHSGEGPTVCLPLVGRIPPPVSTSGRGQLGLTARLGSGGLYGDGCRCS
ncbi:hypothetical protein RHMOL_Rhmol12G0089100 [Rhododendron molle]|uniref:Uncharacterized protein n=1 Tax=Rhododendron molle TaxID=49168 RepID=A0ACC0LFT1_RHOML|nr:hypothetical protein RHMOL_Rhmol12G0089100 [Rhododendron molle]